MSLKNFHLVFVTVSMLLCAFLAAWAFFLSPERNAVYDTIGYIGVAGLVLMPVYGVYFYRKAARIQS